MSKCVCKGNWRKFVGDAEPLLGKKYITKSGITWVFIGLLWAEDDFYWTFQQTCGDNRGKGLFVTCCLPLERVLEVYEMVAV